MPKPLLVLVLLASSALGWVVLDGDARRVATDGAEVLAGWAATEAHVGASAYYLSEEIQQEHPAALVLAGTYHGYPDSIAPESLRRSLEQVLGPADWQQAADYYRRAAEKGDFTGALRYWELVASGAIRPATAPNTFMEVLNRTCFDRGEAEFVLVAVRGSGKSRRETAEIEQALRWHTANCPQQTASPANQDDAG